MTHPQDNQIKIDDELWSLVIGAFVFAILAIWIVFQIGSLKEILLTTPLIVVLWFWVTGWLLSGGANALQ